MSPIFKYWIKYLSLQVSIQQFDIDIQGIIWFRKTKLHTNFPKKVVTIFPVTPSVTLLYLSSFYVYSNALNY